MTVRKEDDIVLLANGWRAQVKSRADGWRRLYADLAGAEVLMPRADRREWLAVLPLARLLALLGVPVQDPAP